MDSDCLEIDGLGDAKLFRPRCWGIYLSQTDQIEA